MHGSGYVLLAALTCAACSQQAEKKSYVARVGNSYLTEGDIALGSGGAHLDTTGLVNEWIASELLYHEALRRDLGDSEELRQQVERVKRRLIVDALLNEELYGDDSLIVTDDDISSYFAAHSKDLLLRSDVARISFAQFDDRDIANAFRSRVLRGTQWNDAVAAIQQDSSSNTHLLQAAPPTFVTQATIYPDELWKLARTLPKETVSFVISTDAGYYVLLLHDFSGQGEVPLLEYVRDEIRDRLLIAARQTKYESLLRDLRTRFPVEIWLARTDTLPSQEALSE